MHTYIHYIWDPEITQMPKYRWVEKSVCACIQTHNGIFHYKKRLKIAFCYKLNATRGFHVKWNQSEGTSTRGSLTALVCKLKK